MSFSQIVLPTLSKGIRIQSSQFYKSIPSASSYLHSRSLHSTCLNLSKASPNDASTGVDPAYKSPSTSKEPAKEYPPSSSTDPFPLPFSHQVTQHHATAQGVDLNSKHQSDGLDQLSVPLRVPGRENEERETMIARLIYQCRKRGTLETDLILATFAKKELKEMDDLGLKEFDAVS